MHELSLCRHMIEIIEKQMDNQSFDRIKKVCVEIGELSNIEREAFEFSFSIISKNTIVSNAVLEIITVPGRSACEDCHREFALHRWFDPCPFCDGHRLTLLKGEELRIQSLEVE